MVAARNSMSPTTARSRATKWLPVGSPPWAGVQVRPSSLDRLTTETPSGAGNHGYRTSSFVHVQLWPVGVPRNEIVVGGR